MSLHSLRAFEMTIHIPAVGSPVVTPGGEVDQANATKLARSLAALADAGWPTVLVDLSDTEFLDLSGARALADAHAYLARRGDGSLVLRSPPSAVSRLLAFTGLDRLLAPGMDGRVPPELRDRISA